MKLRRPAVLIFLNSDIAKQHPCHLDVYQNGFLRDYIETIDFKNAKSFADCCKSLVFEGTRKLDAPFYSLCKETTSSQPISRNRVMNRGCRAWPSASGTYRVRYCICPKRSRSVAIQRKFLMPTKATHGTSKSKPISQPKGPPLTVICIGST